MRRHRSFGDVKEDYFRKHPEEIDEFITVTFEEYAKDGNASALLASLRIVSRVKGITVLADETGISRNGIQKALSETGNPKFESVNSILHAMGYSLMPHRLDGRG